MALPLLLTRGVVPISIIEEKSSGGEDEIMKTHIKKLAPLAAVITLVSLFSQLPFSSQSPFPEELNGSGLGDVQTLLAAYDRWKATVAQNGGDRQLFLGLSYSKGLSAEYTKARGWAMLDLLDGSLFVEVSGLPDKESYNIWLVDNQPGPAHSVKPDPDDKIVNVGRLLGDGGTARLHTQLSLEALSGLELDLIVVAREGTFPGEEDLLVGSPSLFQRLYYNKRRGLFAMLASVETSVTPGSAYRSFWSAPFRGLIPAPAYAAQQTADSAVLKSLIAKGEEVFFNETFNGNGRTCGSCHPAENNLTIDPTFIAKLPSDDPLFVAEFNEKLAKLEIPSLMRGFGLILENTDGFDDPTNQFAMRGDPTGRYIPW